MVGSVSLRCLAMILPMPLVCYVATIDGLAATAIAPVFNDLSAPAKLSHC